MSLKMSSLSDLTDGFFSDLRELTPERINTFVAERHGLPDDFKIDPGYLAPMFNRDGTPLLDKTGKHISLPYTHACVFVYEVMKAAGMEHAENDAVRDIPVPFWCSTDIYLVTSDGFAIVAQRSNFNKNYSGLCILAAGGFAKVNDSVAESSEACARREFREETGLSSEKGISLEFRRFDREFNINKYDIKVNIGPALEGRVPLVAEKYSVRTSLTAEEVLRQIKSNGESLGFVAIPINKIDTIERGETIEVPFAPAWETMQRMLYPDRSSLAHVFRSGITSLADLRAALADVERPQDFKAGDASIISGDAAVDAMTGEVGRVVEVRFSRKDCYCYDDTTSSLVWSKKAAAVYGIVPPTSPRRRFTGSSSPSP
jgi:8-oxo-dGTP pyrophosphatase MutT (NUDIX family)